MEEEGTNPAMSGFVDIILSISHDAKHSCYDPKRENSFHPNQRHRPLSSFLFFSFLSCFTSTVCVTETIDDRQETETPFVFSFKFHFLQSGPLPLAQFESGTFWGRSLLFSFSWASGPYFVAFMISG